MGCGASSGASSDDSPTSANPPDQKSTQATTDPAPEAIPIQNTEPAAAPAPSPAPAPAASKQLCEATSNLYEAAESIEFEESSPEAVGAALTVSLAAP